MADDFQMGNGHWWETSGKGFDGGAAPHTTTTTTTTTATLLQSFPPDPSGGTLMFHEGDQSSAGRALANPMVVGYGLSSDTYDWNQAILHGDDDEKANAGFRSMLEEEMGTRDFQRDFLLDQSKFTQASSNDSTVTSQNFPTGFMGLFMSEHLHHPHENQPMLNNYPYSRSSGYVVTNNTHSQFTNMGTPLWTAPEPPAAASPGGGSAFLSAQQAPGVLRSCIHEKPKKMLDVHCSTSKDQNASNKRSRSETPSPAPLKAKKEKMGDRITALQLLVSPFGKTDTASVLSEAIEYIKFLHDQIDALSSPYTKNGASIQHGHQNSSKNKVDREGPCHDLRDRGLCLVPVPNTFSAAHVTAVDFWAPTFGGSFR